MVILFHFVQTRGGMPYLYFYLLEVNNKRRCVKGHLFPHQFKRLKSKYQSMSLHLPSLTVLIPFPSFSHMHSPSSHFELPLHVPCPAATLTCPLPHSHPYMSPAHSHPYISPALQPPLHVPCPSHPYMASALQSPLHVIFPSHPYMSLAPQSPIHVPCPAVTNTCPLPHSRPYMSPALQSPVHVPSPTVTLTWPLPCSHPYMASALHIPPTNYHLLAAQQEPYKKA